MISNCRGKICAQGIVASDDFCAGVKVHWETQGSLIDRAIKTLNFAGTS